METASGEHGEEKSKEDCVMKEALSIVCILHKIKFRGEKSQSVRNLSR